MRMIEDTQVGERFPAAELMGIYLLDGAESVGAIGARVRDLSLDATRLPDLTLVAASPAEAADLLVEDGELREALAIEAVEFVDAGLLGQGRVVLLTTEEGAFSAYIAVPSSLVMSDLLAHVPSPFTAAKGTLRAC